MAGTENEKLRGPDAEPIAVEVVGGKGGTSKYRDEATEAGEENKFNQDAMPSNQEPEPFTNVSTPATRR